MKRSIIAALLAAAAFVAMGCGGSTTTTTVTVAETRGAPESDPAVTACAGYTEGTPEHDRCIDANDDGVTGAPASSVQEQVEDELEETVPVETPDGEYDLDCDYVLGDFDSDDYRFIAGGELENTGNIGIRVQVTFEWERLGTDPIREIKRVRVPVGATRDVAVTVPVTSDDIDLHQAADGDCNVDAEIIGTYGTPVP